MKIRHLLPLTFFSSMGSTASTAHRLEKRQAWHLPHFDHKMVQKVKAEVADKCGRSVGLQGFRPPAHFVGSKNNNSLVISVSLGVVGRSDCWDFVRPSTLLGQKIITVWSTLSRWGGRTVGLLGFRPSDHFVGSKKTEIDTQYCQPPVLLVVIGGQWE